MYSCSPLWSHASREVAPTVHRARFFLGYLRPARYDRILSEYRYLLNVPWGKENPRLRAAPDCTPEGLNTFAARTMHMVLGGQAFLSDCHFVPQASFVWGPQGKQWCQNILRIDTLPTSRREDALRGRKHRETSYNSTPNVVKHPKHNLNAPQNFPR